jgi:hypothetical protein
VRPATEAGLRHSTEVAKAYMRQLLLGPLNLAMGISRRAYLQRMLCRGCVGCDRCLLSMFRAMSESVTTGPEGPKSANTMLAT